MDILADGYPASAIVQCENGNIDPIEETVSAGKSELKFDPLTGKYIYVWKTNKAWVGTCRIITFRFIDGTEVSALFMFIK